MQEQFNLIYGGEFSYLDTQEMTPHEREVFHDMLFKQKQREKEARENAGS